MSLRADILAYLIEDSDHEVPIGQVIQMLADHKAPLSQISDTITGMLVKGELELTEKRTLHLRSA